MLMTVEKFKTYYTPAMTDAALADKLSALESLIRKYTNNKFQNRNIRLECPSTTTLIGVSSYMKVGDTVEISQSGINDGVYVISEISETETTLDKDLFESEENTVTKVEYPMDVILGVVDLVKWDESTKNKVGIQSESISRHSVTYVNQDGVNTIAGYPASLMKFLDPYVKARF